MSNIFIVGTRAQLIKVAPVIYFFEKEQLPVTFILTGQHRDTMQDLIDEFKIKTCPIHLIPNNKEHSNILALLSWFPKIFKLLINFLRKFENANVFVMAIPLQHLLVHCQQNLLTIKSFTSRVD